MNMLTTHFPIMTGQIGTPEDARLQRLNLRESILGGMVVAAVTATICYGEYYWSTGRYLETTDDAYVQADYTTVAPKVSGYIRDVLVEDNTRVTAGQIVARIDDRDFQTALSQAEADLSAANSTIQNIDAQLRLQESIIGQAQAQIGVAEAAAKFAKQDYVRYQGLMKTGFGTIQRAQQAETALSSTEAALRESQAGLSAAKQKIEVLKAERQNALAQRDRDTAQRDQARLNLSYTTIQAPVDGLVGARSLRVGQYVQAGTQLMAVVPLEAAYILANFKETQLTHVSAGQAVEITADAFPGVRFKGHVDSMAPASGLEFALLPPDNATGNFTKIVQRLPVKVIIDDPVLSGRLRAGMSVETTINTRETETEAHGSDSSSRRSGESS